MRPTMRFGEDFTIHYRFLEMVRTDWAFTDHGLLHTDILCADRMNVPRWYRICDPRITPLLLELGADGHQVDGLLKFLELLRCYLDICFNLKISHAERVEKCGFLANTLCRWRHWLYQKLGTGAAVNRNSITMQAFRDMYISIHSMVNGIGACYEKNAKARATNSEEPKAWDHSGKGNIKFSFNPALEGSDD